MSTPPGHGPASDWERATAGGADGGAAEVPAPRPPSVTEEGGAAGVGGEPTGGGGSPQRSGGGAGRNGSGGAGQGGAGAAHGGATAGAGSATAGRGGAGRGGVGGTSAHAGSGAGSTNGGVTGASGDGGGPGSHGNERVLWFSEYVEGSGKNKALELRAAAATSLDGCHVSVYFNGKTEGSGTSLSGELAAGDVYVLCSSTLSTLLEATCDQTLSLTFNGNDAVVLECEGTVVDSIGQLGVDPKTAWSAAGVSTMNQTLRRRCSVTRGDPVATDAFDPSVEWASHPTDDFSGLGAADCD